jgi:hypothetical protein
MGLPDGLKGHNAIQVYCALFQAHDVWVAAFFNALFSEWESKENSRYIAHQNSEEFAINKKEVRTLSTFPLSH